MSNRQHTRKQKTIEPTAVQLGPYLICQKVKRDPRGPKGGAAILPVPDRWVLPGGTEVTTQDLFAIAARNGWKIE